MKRLIQLILYLFLFATFLHAQEQADVSVPLEFPGLSEVIPRSSQLSSQVLKIEESLAGFQDTSLLEVKIQEARNELDLSILKLAEMGDLAAWNPDRLLAFRERIIGNEHLVQKQLNALSERLAKLEDIRKEWSGNSLFWKDWLNVLRDQKVEIPEDTFKKVQKTISGLLDSVSKASAPLITLQKEVILQKEEIHKQLNTIDPILAELRKQIFRKTSRSFASKEYYVQFTPELWAATKKGFAAAMEMDPGFFSRKSWLIAVQILAAFTIAIFIRRHRMISKGTPEWQFILFHPWATGIFVALSGFSGLYETPPSLWRLFLWVLAAVSSSVLISGLVKNPRKRLIVYALASLFVISLTLQIFSLPVPLYRLYVALISLVGVPLLLVMSRLSVRAQQGRVTGFAAALRIGALVLLIIFVTQFAGYSSLSFRLIEASVTTVFLGLFAAMIIRLGQGGIDFLYNHPMMTRKRISRGLGKELTARLKNMFRILVIVYTALYLLLVWGVYDSVKEAWTHLTGISISMGQVKVTLGMVLLAGLVLYVSILISLAIRSFLETEVFPRKKFDRGVRDSINKLLHYSLILIGFLLALTLSGIELRNFAVLAGAFGIGIGFGLQNIVNNFISGLILLFERPIKVGDILVLGEDWGVVKNIGLRSTVVETFDQSEIIVPNSQIISEKVTNWTLSTSISRVVIPVGVAYGSDVPRVLRILMDAAENHPLTLPDPKPSAIFMGFGNSSLDFELRLWIGDVAQRLNVKSEMLQTIDSCFREEGVEIPFPQRDLHLRSADDKFINKLGKSGLTGE